MIQKIKEIAIGILYGGDSPEGQVSILTARAVSESLTSQGYNIVGIDIRDSTK
jgi:D-alanine-D-alanine ligase-like ATP-grasp enzyme